MPFAQLGAEQLAAVSLLFRQTNIVWVAFVAGQAAIRELELPKKEGKSSGGKAVDPPLWDARPGEFGHFLTKLSKLTPRPRTALLVQAPLAIARAALTQLPILAPVIAAYLPVFVAFLAFVRWNGGIVLGAPVRSTPPKTRR